MNSPDALLVDEPTSALDTERGHAVLDLIARITRECAVATVIVTPNPDHLAGADQIVRIVDGQIAAALPA